MALQGIYDQTIFSKIRQSRLLSYGAAILLVALLTLSLKLLFPYLPLGTFASPYVILIALIAYFIGTGPATLAILLGIAAFAYTISGSSMTQLYRLEIYVRLFTYILGTVLGCVAATLIRNSQHRMISLLNDVKSSEEKYRNLFENINELVSIHEAITDENGQVVDWMTLDVNPMLMDVAGITAKDIIGKPVSQSFGQDPSLSFLIEKVNEMFQSGRPIRFSYYSDLQAKHFNVSAFIMGAKRFAFVFFDITKRKKVEEQLADERSRIEALLKALPVGVMIADSTGRVIEVNDLVKNAWGADFPMAQTLEEYSVYEGWWPDTGKPILPDEWPLVRAITEGAVTPGKLIEYQMRTGSRANILLSASPIRDIGGNITGGVVVIQDVTHEMELEKQAQDQAATLSTLLDTIPIGVIVADEETDAISYYSWGAVEIFGGPVTGTASNPSQSSYTLLKANGELFPADELPLTRSLRYGERIFGVELVIRRPSGKEIVALVNSAPVRNPQGRIISAVASVDDATELITLRRELERSLERERNFSILLQRALMPQELLQQKGYSVAVEYTPAFAEREIGGDFYDVFQTKNGSLALLIGDVSGKGLEAASTAAATRNTVRSFAYEYSSASEALSYANQVLFAQMPDYGYFVTVFLVIVDLSTGRIQYASAGHPPAAICHLDGTVEWVTVINLPVGPLDQVNYQEMPGELQVGEKLVLYTDGILEARHEHEMFELEGIERTLKENYTCTPKELASNLIKAATEWADGKLSDDVAILIFERNNPDNV